MSHSAVWWSRHHWKPWQTIVTSDLLLSLMKTPTVTKVFAIPKSTSTETVKLVSLEIYTADKTKGIEYSMLRCPSVFTQTLGEMCSDTEMIRFYEHFVLHRSVLLSEYWREACAKHKNQKEGNVWSDIIMQEYKNWVLSGKHAVAAGDVFYSYLQKGLKKPDNMSPKAFNALRFSSSCMMTSRLIMK